MAWARWASDLLGLADKCARRGFPIKNSLAMTQLVFPECSVFMPLCWCVCQRFPVWSQDPVIQSYKVTKVTGCHWAQFQCGALFLAGFCLASVSNFSIAHKSATEGLCSPWKRTIPILESHFNLFKKITSWNGLVSCLLFLRFFFHP